MSELQSNKLMNLADGKVLYDDLRDRIEAVYTKPSGGIPATDLASAVQTSLGKADTAYQKPSGGIPSTDLADGVIPKIKRYTISLDANSTSNWSIRMGSQHFGVDTFTAKSEVIEARSTNDKYYSNLQYTLDTRSLSYSVTVLPGAPAGTIELFIAEVD